MNSAESSLMDLRIPVTFSSTSEAMYLLVFFLDLLERLGSAQGHQISLQEIFHGLVLVERVGMFLATLELVRLRKVTVQQDDDGDGSIRIALCSEVISDEQNALEH